MNPALRTVLFAPRWNPLKLAVPPVAWWDASLGVTQSGGLVSAWADRIGGASVAQSTGSLKPVFSPSSMNSAYPGITFDGSDDVLSLTGVPAVMATGSASGWLLMLVDQQGDPSAASAKSLVTYGNGTAAQTRESQRSVNTGVNRFSAANGQGPLSEETTVDFTGVHAVLALWTSTTALARIDGREASSAAETNNTATTRLRIGSYCNSTASNFWLGVISHVIAGTGTLTTPEKEKLEAWALWSVGKQSQLASSHTYRNAPPRAARSCDNDNWVRQNGLLVPERKLTMPGFRLAA